VKRRYVASWELDPNAPTLCTCADCCRLDPRRVQLRARQHRGNIAMLNRGADYRAAHPRSWSERRAAAARKAAASC